MVAPLEWLGGSRAFLYFAQAATSLAAPAFFRNLWQGSNGRKAGF